MLGGEQSGHIIIGDIGTTGDGILSAIELCNVLAASGKKLSGLCDAVLYPQVNISITVKDKQAVMADERLIRLVEESKSKLCDTGRVLVRASGTEPKVRVMVECETMQVAEKIANELAEAVRVASEGKL